MGVPFIEKRENHGIVAAGNKGDSRPRHLQGKGTKTGLVRQTLGFLSLNLCNYANFDRL